MNAPSNLMKPIRCLIQDQLAVSVASDDTDLLAEGVLDSVTLVQLIMHLEQSFQIRIELAELEIEDLRSVRSIAALVEKLQLQSPEQNRELAHASATSV